MDTYLVGWLTLNNRNSPKGGGRSSDLQISALLLTSPSEKKSYVRRTYSWDTVPDDLDCQTETVQFARQHGIVLNTDNPQEGVSRQSFMTGNQVMDLTRALQIRAPGRSLP